MISLMRDITSCDMGRRFLVHREIRLGRVIITVGTGRFFGIGFYLDFYHINLDIGLVYISIEW